MFKRVSLVLVFAAIATMFFAACNKAETPAPQAPAATAPTEAVAAPAAPVAPAPDAQLPPPPVAIPPAPPAPETDPNLPPPAPLPQIPPEAQAAVEDLISVMSSIAAAGKKESCSEVLAELKRLNNDDIKAKLVHAQIINNYPEDVQKAINEANQAKLIAIAFEMVAFQKCESSPETEEIDAAIKAILEPIAPPEDAAQAPAPVIAPTAPAAAPEVAETAQAAVDSADAAKVEAAKDAAQAAINTADAGKVDAARAALQAAANDPSKENVEAAKAAAQDALKTADAEKLEAAKAAAQAAINSADTDKIEAAKAAAKAAGLAQ